jgi:predicted dehydrogenase
MSKAIVLGLGGISKNVYVPQLEKLGLEVETVDPNPDTNATYAEVTDIPQENEYDLAVVCTPNAYHLGGVLNIGHVCKRILVEKPGFANLDAWNRVQDRLMPEHDVIMVKNNMYREEAVMLRKECDLQTITKVEITWFNEDRIPNPGSWFTDKRWAFGGVTYDLFPHLYTYMTILFPIQLLSDCKPITFSEQRWNLENIGDETDYGKVNKDGVYDVCDYAEAHYMVPRAPDSDDFIPVILRASWKEGHDDQSIRIYKEDGTVFKWEFGLCPDEVYGTMIASILAQSDASKQYHEFVDCWMHEQLEYFL